MAFNDSTAYFPENFRPLRIVGAGAYGTVYECAVAHPDGSVEQVAVKRLEDYARSISLVNETPARRAYRERYLRRVCREVEILLHFRDVPQIVTTKAIYLSPSGQDLYIVMAFVPLSLHGLLDSTKPYFDSLTEPLARWIVMQILIGLDVMHSAGCMHRDLSLGNVLIDPETMDTFIVDFGLSRVKQHAEESDISLDVMSLPYRAPEILMQCARYSSAVDIWSVGCICVELILKRPFLYGKDAITQLWTIMREVTGFIIPEEWDNFASARALTYLRGVPEDQKPCVPDATQLFISKGISLDAAQVLSAMLTCHPSRRPTARQVLSMPWFQQDPSCVEAIEQGLAMAQSIQPCPNFADTVPMEQLCGMVAQSCTLGLAPLQPWTPPQTDS